MSAFSECFNRPFRLFFGPENSPADFRQVVHVTRNVLGDLRVLIRPFAVGLLACLASACTILPGQNIGPSGRSGISAERVEQVSPGVEVLHLENQAGPIRSVRVVTVSGQTLAAEIVGQTWRANTALESLATFDAAASASEYRVGPGDILSIIVWDHPELTNPTGEFRDPASGGRLIASDGTMFYPYVGTFKVDGMTLAEIRDHLSSSLSRVISKPQIDVRVAAFRSKRVQVSGEVRQPGLVALDDTPKGIVEALNERGGLLETASRREVVLRRGDQRYELDLASLTSGSQAGLNPLLEPGDQIHVPDRSEDQVFVLGRVTREGPVPLEQRRTTLTQIISSAQGIDRLAGNDSGVLVFRRPRGDVAQATVYRLDLSSSMGLLMANEFQMQPRDVVFVSPTSFSQYNSVINQLLPTVTTVYQLDRLINE